MSIMLKLITMALAISVAAEPAASDPSKYFKISVVDEQTGRGVPLVELSTVNAIRYYTDSNGIVAFHEPGLMNQDVFFFVKSHGYEFPADGFGMAGKKLHVVSGGSAELKIKRANIAERLYRITGGGIYRDSVLTGHPVPIRNPVLNGDVLGQDSIQSIIYQGKPHWFWGDTSWPKYPLGNFHMAGATSLLPSDGGLDPDLGVNLTYFVRDNGFAKEMAPRPEPGPVWLDSFVILPDKSGRERMYAGYGRVTSAMKAVERGLMQYNDKKQIFEKVVEFDVNTPVRPGGHPFTHSNGGVEYLWFPNPFPLVRVRAEVNAYLDVGRYEAWTPLREGSNLEAPEIDRDASGQIRYAWRRNTPALDQRRQDELIKAGKMKHGEAWIHLQDADTGKPVMAHNGSVYWNDYRRRWITIRCETFGTSMLGETWYAEADTPLGPWIYARKIVTHEKYDFYNPKHHPFFDKNGGRLIYFEGTYVNTFSGNPDKTPRYDYNQIMFKLDLSDPRLCLPVPIYRVVGQDGVVKWGTARRFGSQHTKGTIVFFALDRPRKGAVPVYAKATANGRESLTVVASAAHLPGNGAREPVFYVLPAETEPRHATTLPLFEYLSENNMNREYSTLERWSAPAFSRSERPLCLVWRNPMSPNISSRFHE